MPSHGWSIPASTWCTSLARGAVSHVYPYPFVDVNQLGYSGVLVRSAMLLLVFLGMGLLVVAVGRRNSGNARPSRKQVKEGAVLSQSGAGFLSTLRVPKGRLEAQPRTPVLGHKVKHLISPVRGRLSCDCNRIHPSLTGLIVLAGVAQD